MASSNEDYWLTKANKLGTQLSQMDKYDANGELTPMAQYLMYRKAVAEGAWEEEAWLRQQANSRRS